MVQELELEIFNFDDPERWDRVQEVAEHPLVQRALAAGMKARCRSLGREWTPEIGPWELADRNNPNWPLLEAEAPKPDSPNWYRIFGHCHSIAPWCAAVGSLLYPDHDWGVWYNLNVPEFGSHSAGIGGRDGEIKSIIIMDILFGQQSLLEGTGEQLMRMLITQESQPMEIEEAIRRLEQGLHL